jgi:hypothetical protein
LDKKGEEMNWKQAVKHMYQGGRITRKSWLPDDYLYIHNHILYCDGGYEYLEYLTTTQGEWLKFKEEKIKEYCRIRKDLQQEGYMVPIWLRNSPHVRHLSGNFKYQCRWLDNDNRFQIKIQNQWYEAHSIDFDFL